MALPAGAACYECTYIWFVGRECDSVLEEGESGKTLCNDTNQCYLHGVDCPTEGGGSCGDGEGGCEPEQQGMRLQETDSLVKLASNVTVEPLFADESRCLYRID